MDNLQPHTPKPSESLYPQGGLADSPLTTTEPAAVDPPLDQTSPTQVAKQFNYKEPRIEALFVFAANSG